MFIAYFARFSTTRDCVGWSRGEWAPGRSKLGLALKWGGAGLEEATPRVPPYLPRDTPLPSPDRAPGGETQCGRGNASGDSREGAATQVQAACVTVAVAGPPAPWVAPEHPSRWRLRREMVPLDRHRAKGTRTSPRNMAVANFLMAAHLTRPDARLKRPTFPWGKAWWQRPEKSRRRSPQPSSHAVQFAPHAMATSAEAPGFPSANEAPTGALALPLRCVDLDTMLRRP